MNDEHLKFALFSFVCGALLEIQFVLEDLRMKFEAANWICLVLCFLGLVGLFSFHCAFSKTSNKCSKQ